MSLIWGKNSDNSIWDTSNDFDSEFEWNIDEPPKKKRKISDNNTNNESESTKSKGNTPQTLSTIMEEGIMIYYIL